MMFGSFVKSPRQYPARDRPTGLQMQLKCFVAAVFVLILQAVGQQCPPPASKLVLGSHYKDIISQSSSGHTTPIRDNTGLPRFTRAPGVADVQIQQDGRFHVPPSNFFTLELLHYLLKRFEPAGIRQCLADKTWAFFGGATLRAMYYHLAFTISRMTFMDPYSDDPAAPAILDKKQFDSWSSYYQAASQALSCTADGTAEETCNCSRDPAGAPIEVHDYKLSFTEAAAPDASHQIKLHMRYLQSPFGDAQAQDNAAIREAMKVLKPDVVVLGLDVWDPTFQDADILAADPPIFSKVSKAFEAVLRAAAQTKYEQQLNHTHLVWVRTPESQFRELPRRKVGQPSSNHKQAQPLVNEQLLDDLDTAVAEMAAFHGFQVLDARSMTKAALRQRLNFYKQPGSTLLPIMYQNLNEVLLNLMCP